MPKNIDVEFYKPRGTLATKEWEKWQKSDYTHVNKYMEGLCYFCEKNRFVFGTFVDVCLDRCFHRFNKRSILKPVKPFMDGWCYGCHQFIPIRYNWNIIKLNVRACSVCMRRIELARIRAGNDPYRRFFERQYGNEWETVSGMDGLV